MRIAFAVDRALEDAVIGALVERGHDLVARFSTGDDVPAVLGSLSPDVLVVSADPEHLTRAVLAACDDGGVRLVALLDGEPSRRLSVSLGVYDVVSVDAPIDDLDELVIGATATARAVTHSGGVVAVWGPSGAPGRTTVAITIAHELARSGATVALVDADTVGSSVAASLGMLDEAPGLAAACRLVGQDALTTDELERVARDHPVDAGRLAVLTGISRSSRWPELSADRVSRTLDLCRSWADHVVIDSGFSLEDDEELSSDLFAPRRNAATVASLRSADRIVAVGAADPVGVTRFIRAYSELREIVGDTRVDTVMNRVRSSTIGVGAGHQLVTTLRRFGGIEDAVLVPNDARTADAAVLEARPMGEVSPRSPAVAEIRRYVKAHILPQTTSRSESRRSARRDDASLSAGFRRAGSRRERPA
ncbi:Flp pilus assembly CpaE family ATPase [Labedella gwakjiensis]|uniref:Flp pilus assembly CpaE family ATPase n=1 Tax=Labedella gwakjiensis TaxID=390269 RepID=A0A2P8GXZ0_9MICO|nr:P-loop NTPase [Labedella gwakjiensis]PSL38838.1 Flp pilus assembly CpaE family ATPase [Labedella gwakjiensis]RUQ86693.1 regulator [Labedella gwakjiensis]